MSDDKPRQTPRQRRRVARINHILLSSLEILIAEGLDGLTTQRLADAVDLTPGALYRYFPSKDAILVELQSRVFLEMHGVFVRGWERGQRHLERQAPEAPESLAPLMAAVLTARMFVDMQQEAPTRFGLVSLGMSERRYLLNDEDVQPVLGVVMGLMADVNARLEACAETGALTRGDSAVRAMNLLFAIHGVLLMNKFKRFSPELINPRAMALRTVRTIFLGWGASPNLLEQAEALIDGLMQEEALIKDGLAAHESEWK